MSWYDGIAEKIEGFTGEVRDSLSPIVATYMEIEQFQSRNSIQNAEANQKRLEEVIPVEQQIRANNIDTAAHAQSAIGGSSGNPLMQYLPWIGAAVAAVVLVKAVK